MTQPPQAPPVRVLIVDDDEDTSELLGILFRRVGWQTEFASDLAQARSLLAVGDISALVTDMNLPDGRGLSLLASGRHPSLRAAILITGQVAENDRRESVLNGFDAYIVKPFEGVKLVGHLASLVAEVR